MLDQRTQNIIFVCKGRHNYGSNISMRDAVARYMSDTTGCDIERYSDVTLLSIIKSCILDIMENCSKDICRRLIFDYFDYDYLHNNELDKWLVALDLMQVKEFVIFDEESKTGVHQFLEGFSQDYVIDENTNEMMFPEFELGDK